MKKTKLMNNSTGERNPMINILLCILMAGGVLMAASTVKSNSNLETATFAGGCFWCMEPPFEHTKGVVEVKVGYTGGKIMRPDYEVVSSGLTGHYEAVQVLFDTTKVSYDQLLEVFWHNIDPTDQAGQFADKGSQYKTAIFFHTQKQREVAELSKANLEKSAKFNKPIATKILEASTFYPAEEYHQNYYLKNPLHYSQYKKGSGREEYIERTWKNEQAIKQTQKNEKKYSIPSKEKLKQILTPEQYSVTQKNGTEPAFENKYYNNHREGIYVDVVSGEPLFSSKEKFESGSGWPSFYKPLVPGNISEKKDMSNLMLRTEVRSRHANSHLGHMFNDGPAPTGLRYCINSAALRFIPKEDLEKEGYGEYRVLFKD